MRMIVFQLNFVYMHVHTQGKELDVVPKAQFAKVWSFTLKNSSHTTFSIISHHKMLQYCQKRLSAVFRGRKIYF